MLLACLGLYASVNTWTVSSISPGSSRHCHCVSWRSGWICSGRAGSYPRCFTWGEPRAPATRLLVLHSPWLWRLLGKGCAGREETHRSDHCSCQTSGSAVCFPEILLNFIYLYALYKMKLLSSQNSWRKAWLKVFIKWLPTFQQTNKKAFKYYRAICLLNNWAKSCALRVAAVL